MFVQNHHLLPSHKDWYNSLWKRKKESREQETFHPAVPLCKASLLYFTQSSRQKCKIMPFVIYRNKAQCLHGWGRDKVKFITNWKKCRIEMLWLLFKIFFLFNYFFSFVNFNYFWSQEIQILIEASLHLEIEPYFWRLENKSNGSGRCSTKINL